MKHLLKGKKTVAVIWILVYVILLVIPILGNTYILMSVNSYVKAETESRYNYFLKSLGVNIDSALKEVESAKKMIQESDSVREMSKVDKVTPQVLYDLSRIANELYRMTPIYEGIYEKFVYFPKINKIVITSNYYDAENYFESEEINPGIEGFDYKEILYNSQNFVITDKYIDENKIERNMYHFITGADRGAGCIIGISVDEANMFGGEIDLQKADIAILKRRGDIYISTDDSLKAEDFEDIKELEPCESKEIKLGGSSVGISYVNSEITNYKYVYIDRSEYIYSAVRRIMLIGMLVSFICILLMAIILYKLYSWNYLNIKEVMIGLSDGEMEIYDENEFEFIKRSINARVEKQKIMEAEMNNQIEAAHREEFLIELLRGSIGGEEYIADGLEKFNISFSGNYFCVTVISVKDFGVTKDSGLKNAHFIIKNIMSDMCRSEEYLSLEYADRLFYIFNFNDSISPAAHLRGLLTECGEITKMATEIVFSSATSELAEGMESLPYLYEEAVNDLNLGEFYGMEEHIFKEDLESVEAVVKTKYTEDAENEIIMSIKAGDRERMDSFIDKLLSDRTEPKHRWIVIGRAYSVLNRIFKMIEDLNSGQVKEAMAKLNSFKEYDNIGSIKAFISEYGEYAMELINSGNQGKSDLYNEAVEYINQHFTEPDLNVNRVSEELGVTSIYLAYVVKQNSGIKLSEYIGKLRIDRAKQLLEQQPELKVDKVAEMSGFWQNRTFYNTFKKFTGFTPTQYKMVNKKNDL